MKREKASDLYRRLKGNTVSGYSIRSSYEQIENLMQEILWEQNERRKSELDALQSQINPHFLYNALDSITWMIEEAEMTRPLI